MKKKVKACFLSLLFFPVLMLFTTQCRNDFGEGQTGISRSDAFVEPVEIQWEEKKYWTGTIDEDFDGSSVLMTMDKNAGGVNKRHDKSFFGGIEIESIEDLTYFTTSADKINTLGINWELWRQILCLNLPGNSKENVVRAIRHLEKIDGIRHVGPNHIGQFGAVPNDPDYGDQWGLNGTNGIQAPAAWDITTGSRNVRVGIIDSGIANHPGLNANLAAGWDFYNKNDITDDDPIGHGTHVAGIVGAVGNNKEGVSGVCWNVTLVPLQVVYYNTDANEWKFNMSAVIGTVQYATDNGIPILNYSGGGGGYNDDLKQAIERYPGLFVTIAGNGTNNNGIGKDNDNDNPKTPFYPANNDLDNIIAVGAICRDGFRASFSNWGSRTVDLFAPGNTILSTYPEAMCDDGTHDARHFSRGYHNKPGTSMAAPFVTGVAALIKTIKPALTPQEIKHYIESTVDAVPQLAGLCVTGGRLNAYEALAAAGYKPPYYLTVAAYKSAAYEYHLGRIQVNADGTCAAVPEERRMRISPLNQLPFYHDLDTVGIEDCLSIQSSRWGVFYSLKKNNIPSVSVTCGMTFLAVISQVLYLVEVNADITISGGQAVVSNVYNMRIIEEIEYGVCVDTKFY
jgi:hypothetical protein